MAMYILPLLSTLLVLPGLLESKKYNHILPNGGQIWAFLVAGSDGYGNYRHQADVCHAYQLLHQNGIPDSNIIVMMTDDIAYNEENPTPGIIINKPNGTNVYSGVPKDYTGKDVNIRNFLNVLSGNKQKMEGIGSGRVIESGLKDHIFLNFVDHGSAGVLIFPEEEMSAAQLLKTLENMAANKQFEKMIIYVEACNSGSMFDNILPEDLDIFVTTAADPHESSYAIYYDDKRQVYLGDAFSVMWMDDAEHEELAAESLHHQFQRVRTATNTSHVEEYGDLDIGNTKLHEIIGDRTSMAKRKEEKRVKITDAVSNYHVPVAILTKKLAMATTPEERHSIHLELKRLQEKRNALDNIVLAVLRNSVSDSYVLSSVLSSTTKLTRSTMYCHKNIVSHFSSECFSIAKNPYSLTHMQRFINLCNLPSFNESTAISAITKICGLTPRGLIGTV